MSALSRMLVPVVCLQSEDTAVRQSWSRMKWPSCVLIEQWIYKHGAMKNVRTPAQRAPNASMVVIVVTIVTREVCHPKMGIMKKYFTAPQLPWFYTFHSKLRTRYLLTSMWLHWLMFTGDSSRRRAWDSVKLGTWDLNFVDNTNMNTNMNWFLSCKDCWLNYLLFCCCPVTCHVSASSCVNLK